MEGLEVVGAYMTDPLWVAEYTLYLEQNFCVGHSERCVPAVKVSSTFTVFNFPPFIIILSSGPLPSHARHDCGAVLETSRALWDAGGLWSYQAAPVKTFYLVSTL